MYISSTFDKSIKITYIRLYFLLDQYMIMQLLTDTGVVVQFPLLQGLFHLLCKVLYHY